MGRTKKPCPGCGEVHPHRSAAEVCHDCKEHIELGKQAIAESKITEPGNVWVRGITRIPYIPHGEIGWRDDPDHRDIDDALLAVFRSVAAPSKKRDHNVEEQVFTLEMFQAVKHHADRERSWYEPDVQVPAEFLDAFRALYVDLCHVLEHAHEEGRQSGQALLSQLASGEVSVVGLNEDTARAEGLRYKPFRGTAAKDLRKKSRPKKKGKKKRKRKSG